MGQFWSNWWTDSKQPLQTVKIVQTSWSGSLERDIYETDDNFYFVGTIEPVFKGSINGYDDWFAHDPLMFRLFFVETSDGNVAKTSNIKFSAGTNQSEKVRIFNKMVGLLKAKKFDDNSGDSFDDSYLPAAFTQLNDHITDPAYFDNIPKLVDVVLIKILNDGNQKYGKQYDVYENNENFFIKSSMFNSTLSPIIDNSVTDYLDGPPKYQIAFGHANEHGGQYFDYFSNIKFGASCPHYERKRIYEKFIRLLASKKKIPCKIEDFNNCYSHSSDVTSVFDHTTQNGGRRRTRRPKLTKHRQTRYLRAKLVSKKP